MKMTPGRRCHGLVVMDLPLWRRAHTGRGHIDQRGQARNPDDREELIELINGIEKTFVDGTTAGVVVGVVGVVVVGVGGAGGEDPGGVVGSESCCPETTTAHCRAHRPVGHVDARRQEDVIVDAEVIVGIASKEGGGVEELIVVTVDTHSALLIANVGCCRGCRLLLLLWLLEGVANIQVGPNRLCNHLRPDHTTVVGVGITTILVGVVVVGVRHHRAVVVVVDILVVRQNLLEQGRRVELAGLHKEAHNIDIQFTHLVEALHEAHEARLGLRDCRIFDFQIAPQQICVANILLATMMIGTGGGDQRRQRKTSKKERKKKKR